MPDSVPPVPPAGKVPGIGKLVVFAGLEAGSGNAFCAASVAVRLAGRWHCLAIDLDPAGRTLRNYLPLKSQKPKKPESSQDGVLSLESLKCRSEVKNIEFVEWPSLPRIEPLLPLLSADRSDYVLATLTPGANDDAFDLFCAADVSIVVTPPGVKSLEKVVDFLRRVASRGTPGRRVHILLNHVQRGGEEKETADRIESAQKDLGIALSLIGAITYDVQKAGVLSGTPLSSQVLQGKSSILFEDIASKIERLLPRKPSEIVSSINSGTVSRRTGLFDAVKLFGRKKELEEGIRQRDAEIARLRVEHDAAVIEEKPAVIGNLEEEIERLEGDLAARHSDIENLQSRIRQLEQAAEMPPRIEEVDRGESERQRLQDENGSLLQEKAALLLEKEALVEARAVLQKERERTDLERIRLHDENVRLAGLLSQEKKALIDENSAIASERDAIAVQLAQVEELARRQNRLIESKDSVIGALSGHLVDLSLSHETIRQYENMIRQVEEANQQLKFDLMSALESSAARPGPDALVRARDGLVQRLRVQPSQSITILSIDSGGPDTFDFAIELRSVLEYAQWDVKFLKSSFDNGVFYGLQIIHDGSSSALASARILCDALESAGIVVGRRTAPAVTNLSPLRLIVGRSNWLNRTKS